MTWERGLDVSFSSASLAWCQARKAEGHRIGVQCLWTGGYASNDGIKAVAATNLQNMEAAGLIPTGYANATPPDWWPVATQIKEIRTNAGAMWSKIRTVFIDVEIVGTTKARVIELADALRAEGKNVQFEPLYTGRWFWVGHMGNDKDPMWKRFKLWNAYYDSDPDIDFGANPYGPWTVADLVGEQYQNTTNVGGVSIDLNLFNLDYFTEEDMPLSTDDLTKIAQIVRANTAEGLVRETGQNAVYHVSLGMKRHVKNGNIFNAEGFDWDNIGQLSAADMALIEDFDVVVARIVAAEVSKIKVNITAAQVLQLAEALKPMVEQAVKDVLEKTSLQVKD